MLSLVYSRRASRLALTWGVCWKTAGLPCSTCLRVYYKVSVGEVLGPVFSAYTYFPAGMEAGGGAGNVRSATPL